MENIIDKKMTPEECLNYLKDIKKGTEAKHFDTNVAKSLVDWFISVCWQLEDFQNECFSRLVNISLMMPHKTKFDLIPYLVEKSINYQEFMFLARRLFSDFSEEEQKTMKIPPITWSNTDDYTFISQNEYKWRQKNGLPCGIRGNNNYTRPVTTLDLECFYVSLELTYDSNTSALIFVH